MLVKSHSTLGVLLTTSPTLPPHPHTMLNQCSQSVPLSNIVQYGGKGGGLHFEERAAFISEQGVNFQACTTNVSLLDELTKSKHNFRRMPQIITTICKLHVALTINFLTCCFTFQTLGLVRQNYQAWLAIFFLIGRTNNFAPECLASLLFVGNCLAKPGVWNMKQQVKLLTVNAGLQMVVWQNCKFLRFLHDLMHTCEWNCPHCYIIYMDQVENFSEWLHISHMLIFYDCHAGRIIVTVAIK